MAIKNGGDAKRVIQDMAKTARETAKSSRELAAGFRAQAFALEHSAGASEAYAKELEKSIHGIDYVDATDAEGG